MAGLIKKQILKILTKFTSGLQPEDIQLSSLKGEAELRNITLDNEALQDLLDLPTWIRINRARVNSVSLKIQWTSLQSKPIRISLDQIELEAETLQEPRPPNGPSPIQDLASSNNSSGTGSYGFTEKVFEGIRLEINAVSIKFNSVAFSATLTIQLITIFSARENWTQSQDLRETRKQDDREVVTRKKIQWNSVRVEANWKDAAPVRLITNQGEIRIMLRRRIADCAVLANRIEIILDDLLWILSDRQIQATLLCVKSLSEAIEASKRQTMRNQRSNSDMSIMSDMAQPPSQNGQSAPPLIVESSQHFSINRLDLHICEESAQASAVQITLTEMSMDYYPARKAARSRKEFKPYTEAMMARDKWIESILQVFREDFKRLREFAKPVDKITKLKENVFIFRLTDMDIYQVSSPTRQNTAGLKLLSSTRADFNLPSTTPFIHFETTDYFTPDGRDYPMPHNNVFVQVNALLFEFDFDTIVWFHKMFIEANEIIQTGLKDLGIEQDTDLNPDHQDIRAEIIMPKFNIDGLQINASRIIFANTLDIGQSTNLGNLIDIFKFVKPSYSLPENTLSPFSNLINELDRPLDRYLGTCPKYELCRAAMILKQKDEISVLQVEQLWIDLNSKNECQKRTLVNPVSASVFIHEGLIISQLDEIAVTLNHDQLMSLMQISEMGSKLGQVIECQTPVDSPNTTEKKSTQTTRIEVVGKGVIVDFDLAPFSSLLAQCPNEIDPLTGQSVELDEFGNGRRPTELPPSTLRAVISPLSIQIIQKIDEFKMTFLSRIEVQTRNYQSKPLQPTHVPNLNGNAILQVLKEPQLIVQMEKDIQINIQNCSLSIYNSIISDLGPFFESPIQPATDGPSIKLSLDNISVQLEPDLPSFYPSSVILPLTLHLEHLGLLMNPDGSLTITRPKTSSSIPPVTSHPLNGEFALPKMENHPKPPPRPSISSKTASTQTSKSNHSSDALIELQTVTDDRIQERNMSLQQERAALSEALEKMQDELIQSEERCEIYKSQLQAMKQLINHQKRF